MNEDSPFPKHSERRDAAANRQRIVTAALKLFEENGIEDVSMNQIATEAKVGPGTLYRRYHNKSDLCLDLIQDSIDRLFTDMDSYLAANSELSPDARLMGLLRLLIRFREKKIDLLKGVDVLVSKKHTFINSPLHDKLQKLFVGLFEEMADSSSSLPTSVFKADLLIATFSNQFYLFQKETRGYSPEKFLTQLDALFLKK